MLAAIMLYTRIDGWLPEARAVVPGQPLISVTALPDARLPLSMQYSTLPRSEFAGFSAERMAVLRAAAERALGNQAH